MAIREVRIFGDPVLRSVCDPIVVGDARVTSLVDDLLDTVEVPGRAGLAANQIGVALRAFSYNVDGEKGYILNPELVEASGAFLAVDEGCLSVPGFYFPRPRFEFAAVSGIDLMGEPLLLSGNGLIGQVLQHELDHLNGHLFIEDLEPTQKREAMRLIRQAPWY